MVETLFLVMLLLYNLVIACLYFKAVHPSDGWVSPLAVVLLFYAFNYPLRAAVLFFTSGTSLEWGGDSWEYSFSREEIVDALTYATLFMGFLVGFYSLLCKRREGWLAHKAMPYPSGLSNSWQLFTFYSLFLAYVLVFIYRAMTGELFGLYEKLEELKRPFFINVLFLVMSLKWFLLGYGFLQFQTRKSLRVLVLTVSMSLTIIVSTIVSTGKGEMVTFALLWIIGIWLVRRRIPRYTVAVAACAVMVFAFYSYSARKYAYHGVRDAGESTLKTVQNTVKTVAKRHEADKDLWKKQAPMMFNRFQGLDGLIMCQRKKPFLNDNMYIAGSLVEFGNAFPRPIWPTRPHLSFNHHVTHAVWGRSYYSFLEMPIGRIGESFFVLSWAGLFYALFYALFWNWLYVRFMMRARDNIGLALYLCLLCLIVLPDAYLVYNWKLVTVVAAGYWLLRSNDRINVVQTHSGTEALASTNG